MKLFHRSWIAPKFGNKIEETEDAYRLDEIDSNGTTELFVAVSDGASETVFCRRWAKSLVEGAKPDWTMLKDEDLMPYLQQIRQEFKPLDSNQEYPWFVREKFFTQGSQATLLVASMKCQNNAKLFDVQALSIGDSCLFVFQAKTQQIHAFPMSSSQEFGVNPVLLSNRPQNVLKIARMSAISIEVGDFAILCTDAIAQWMLRCVEQDQSPLVFETLVELLSPEKSSKPAPPSEEKPEIAEQNPSVQEESIEPPFLRRILANVRNLFSGEPADEEVTQPVIESNSEAPAVTEPEKTHHEQMRGKDIFESFLDKYRAREATPRMRNDDSTLIFCMPVLSEEIEGQLQEVLDMLRKDPPWRLNKEGLKPALDA